ncbi:hypothetical protein AY599_07060 [Leptolyngbya valderiana BDU 20041]|nr:hypothetical protein AY599_07060 [Leptolyngbya valderiana BDU 20041]
MELIITIAVVAILLAIAVPSLRAVLQNNRITAQINELQTAMQFARSEALKRAGPVSVCASDTSSADDADLECGADWTLGWIAYVDGNLEGNSATVIEEVLRRWPGTGGDTTLGHNGNEDFVRYLEDGAIDTVSMPAAASGNPPPPWVFQMRIPDCTGNNGRDLSIIRTGRSSIERVDCT